MFRFNFELWWACRERPFFAASQFVQVVAETETDALAYALAKVPDGPLLHADGGCCYISLWRDLERLEA